jgi:hypothetical protein
MMNQYPLRDNNGEGGALGQGDIPDRRNLVDTSAGSRQNPNVNDISAF